MNNKIKKLTMLSMVGLTLMGSGASAASVLAASKLTTDTELLKAVDEAKKAGVNVSQKSTINRDVGTSDESYVKKEISNNYDNQIKSLKDITAKEVTQDKKYTDDLAAWKKYMENPDYNNNSDWTKDQVDKFLNGDGANVTYITGNKATDGTKMGFKLVKGTKLTQSEFDAFKKNANKNNPNQVTEKSPDNVNTVFVKNSNGVEARWTNADTDAKTGKNIDVSLKSNSFTSDSTSLGNVTRIEKKKIGENMFNRSTSYTETFYQAGTNTKMKIDPLSGFGDVDNQQYIKYKGASTQLVGKMLQDKGNGFIQAPNKATDPEKTEGQAWFMNKSVDHVDFEYGIPTDHVAWQETGGYFEIGGIDFAMKLKPRPVEPAKLKADYQLTKLKVVDDKLTKSVVDNGKDVDHASEELGKDYNYDIVGRVHEFDSKGNKTTKLDISDDLEDVLNLKAVKVSDISDVKKPIDITKDGKLTIDPKTSKFVWTSNDASKLVGHTIKVTVTASIKKDADLSKYVNKDGKIVIPNTAQFVYNGLPDNSNTPTVTPNIPNPKIPAPTKSETDKDGKDLNGKTVKVGDQIIYWVNQQVNTLGKDINVKYKSFIFEDNLPKEVTFDKKVELVDNKNGKYDASKVGKLDFDEKNNTVKYTLNADFLAKDMKLDGRTYSLKIYTTVDKDAENVEKFENTASRTIDGDKQDTNKVDNNVKKPEEKVLPQTGAKETVWDDFVNFVANAA